MTQANNVGQLTPQVNSSGVLQVAGGGTGLSAVGTSGYVLASNGSANVYVSAVGYSGYSGYSGSNGTSGFSGYSGTNGTNGASGTSGYSGATGSNGSTGTSGYSGYSGTGASATANAIGSYILCWMNLSCNQVVTYGSNYAIGTPTGQIQFAGLAGGSGVQARGTSGLSGTWKWMGATFTAGGCGGQAFGIAVRVS